MANPNKNPLSAFASTPAAFTLPPRPRLSMRMAGRVPTRSEIEGHEAEDEEWRQSVQRLISDQFAKYAPQIPKSGTG